jgi:eukaryotic-like serine/threonine-protein kinase
VDPERWRRVGDVFSGALECPPEERSSYLAGVCGNDTELRDEIARLVAEFEKSGEFLERAIASPGQSLAAGDFVAGRYRIENLIQRGGMGEVYCAHDELMNERVALKTLRPEMAVNPDLLKRFQREIQLARKVTHPNVCRVFDAGLHNQGEKSQLFFTMELLDGETLAARIRRTGKIPFEEALPLIAQMAAGLDAARDAGIIHRDFKSANVIVCDGRAVITDFGLATASADVQVAGTVAYMSPEQLCGEAVTAVSDIYSFGVVLFEMAAGRLPFDDRNIIQSAMQRAADTHADVRGVAPETDSRWARAIHRCLERDPAKRFQKAGDVVAYLEAPRLPLWRSSTALIAGIILALLSGLWGISRFHYRSPREGATVIVTPTVNETGEARFSGITTALNSSIGQSARFNLWDNARLNGVMALMRRSAGQPLAGKDWREVAFREGAAMVVFSTLSRSGDSYSLTLHAEQIGAAPDPPMRTWNHTLTVESAEGLFAAVHDASTWFREAAGETPAQVSAHNRLSRNITTSSWEALQLFAESERLGAAGRSDDAISFLRRAIEQDPKFAMAMMRLGDRLVSQRNSKEGFRFWRDAIAEGRNQHLAEGEWLGLETRYDMEIGDFAAAEPVLLEWSSKFPNDHRPASWLVATLLYEGKLTSSADAGQNYARRFAPDVFTAGQTINALGMLNRLDEIPAQIETIEKLGKPVAAARFRGLLALSRGQYPAAREWLNKYRAQASGPEASTAITLLAHAAADEGDFEGAIGMLREGIELDRRNGWNGLAAINASGLSFLMMETRRGAESREWALEAVSFEASAEVISRSIAILARLGFVGEAKDLLARIPPGEGPIWDGLVSRSRAEIFLAERKFDLAIENAEKARRVADASQAERMARIFEAAGQTHRAQDYYRTFTTTPWSCWLYAEREWPGLCRSARLRNLN